VLGGAAALMVAAGIVLTWTIAGWLEKEFDEVLATKALGLAALTEEDGSRVEFDFVPERAPEFGDVTAPEYFELWLSDGTLLTRSPSFERSDATRRARLFVPSDPGGVPVFRDIELPDGRRGRQVRLDFVPRRDPEGGPPFTLIVARERAGLDADLRRLSLGVGLFTGLLLIGLAGLTHAALRVGLRSLDALTGQVRALDARSIATRVRVNAPPEEIAVVVEQLNALLDRLEAGFERERRLSSDLAHELKTPIAELRTLAEVGARWPDDAAAVRAFFDDARAIALQMERTVVHLLALARYDEGQESIHAAPVKVVDVVEAAWKPLAAAAAERRLEYHQRVSPSLCFVTDPDKLHLMVANILSNAVAYSPPGTTIGCESSERDGRGSVSFTNRAQNLEANDVRVMFDRFWRKEEARTGGRNAGLGLALVRAMADLLSIEIVTRLDADKTLSITLCGPDDGQNRNCASTPIPQAPGAQRSAAPGKK
jgi:signal transduction histidine kinase